MGAHDYPALFPSETNREMQLVKSESSDLRIAVSHGHSSMVSASPGILEIEAASDAVNIHDFAGKEEPRTPPTLHGFQIDLFQVNTPTGHEFFFVHALATHLERRRMQLIDESRQLMTGEL